MDIPTGTIARRQPRAHGIVAPVLVGTAAFCVTLAALLHGYVLSRFERLPLNPDTKVQSRGSGTYRDPLTSASASGTLVRTDRVTGDPASGSARTAVWNVSTQLTNADGDLVASWAERVALDRMSARSVHCCGERPRHSGLTYAFPPRAERSSYPLYDPLVRQSFPARFAGADRVHGLDVYRYVSVADREEVASARLLSDGSRRSGEALTYDASRTVWVEPRSGVIVRETQHQRLLSTAPTTSPGERVLLDLSSTWSPASVTSAVRTARDRSRQLWLVGVLAPIAALTVGLLAAAAAVGVFVGIRRESRRLGSAAGESVAP